MKNEEKRMGPGMGMEMMKQMMEDMGGMPPMEMCMKMCRQMTEAITGTAKMTSFATPELRGLFEEWAKAVEEEILGLLKEKAVSEPSEIATKLKLSEESVLFFIDKMAREGKLKVTGITL